MRTRKGEFAKMSEKTARPSYWAVIPADVRYDDQIPANAKLLYGEISALCDRTGYCWAKNEYFAQLFGFAEVTVSRLVSALQKGGYLEVEMVPTETGTERRIYAGISAGGLIKNDKRGLIKKDKGVSSKLITPPGDTLNMNNIYTPIPPKEERVSKRVHKDVPDWKPERFSGFWDFYPRKGRKNKQRAIAAWDRLKPNDELIATIGHALVLLKATDEWKREIGIPHVATFLNGERWHDADELAAPEIGSPSKTVERPGDYEI